MEMPVYASKIVNYVRQNPIKGSAAIMGLAGLLGSIGIVAADPTPLPTKYLVLYFVSAPAMLAGAASLSVWLAQGIETWHARRTN